MWGTRLHCRPKLMLIWSTLCWLYSYHLEQCSAAHRYAHKPKASGDEPATCYFYTIKQQRWSTSVCSWTLFPHEIYKYCPEAVTLLTRIWQLSVLHLSWNTKYTHWGFTLYASVPQDKCWDSTSINLWSYSSTFHPIRYLLIILAFSNLRYWQHHWVNHKWINK